MDRTSLRSIRLQRFRRGYDDCLFRRANCFGMFFFFVLRCFTKECEIKLDSNARLMVIALCLVSSSECDNCLSEN